MAVIHRNRFGRDARDLAPGSCYFPQLDASSKASSRNSNNRRLSLFETERRSRRFSFSTDSKRDVVYDASGHISVIFQMHGSVWPNVIYWCIAVVIWTVCVSLLRDWDIVDLTMNDDDAYGYMSVLVSFLLTSRINIAYNRFMEARQYLENAFTSTREVVQYTCMLSSRDSNAKARNWRNEVAYRSIVTLRTTVTAVEYQSKGISAIDVLHEEDKRITELLDKGDAAGAAAEFAVDPFSSTENLADLAHSPKRRTMDENFRVPLIWAYNLREKLMDTRGDNEILVECPMHVNEESKLTAIVGEFIVAYHGLTKLIATPFPFPLVQMCRTFLFLWIFSLPLSILAKADTNTLQAAITMFIITFGFVGLESVSVELDDPYGTDPNDFPVRRWAEKVIEDIYIAIYKTDGYESAEKLRSEVSERFAHSDAYSKGTDIAEAPNSNLWTLPQANDDN